MSQTLLKFEFKNIKFSHSNQSSYSLKLNSFKINLNLNLNKFNQNIILFINNKINHYNDNKSRGNIMSRN